MRTNGYEQYVESVIDTIAEETGLEEEMRRLDQSPTRMRQVGRAALKILRRAGHSTADLFVDFWHEIIADGHDPL